MTSSSSSSAADVDVHAAWDNYDLKPPPAPASLARRRSDDRCSLLTHWTDSTASLKSCLSHGAVSRSLADDSADGHAGDRRRRRAATGTCRRHPGHHDRCRGGPVDSTSSSKDLADGDLPPLPRGYRTRHESVAQRCRDDAAERRRRSPSFRGGDGGRPATWSRSAARRRPQPLTANHDDDDDEYITTSSDGDDDRPSTSASSSAPPNRADDRASLLTSSSSSSKSSSSAAAVTETATPYRRTDHRCPRPAPSSSNRHFIQSPSRRKSSDSCCRPLTTSSHVDDDDDDDDDDALERSSSSEKVTVISRYLSSRSQATAGPSLEHDVRAVRSLFEFRSVDELRIANDFISGVWSLFSRRSLYNERRVAPLISTSPMSVLQFGCSGSEKDLEAGCDAGEIVIENDEMLYINDFNENKQLSLTTERNNQNAGDDNNSNCGLNVADVVVKRDGAVAVRDLNGWRKEFCSMETTEKLNRETATANDDRRSRDAEVHECRLPQSNPINFDGGKHSEDVADSDVPSHRLDDTSEVGGKSTLLPSAGLADMLGLRTLIEGDGRSSRFPRNVIPVFDALLVHSGVKEATSFADIKMLHPLAADSVASERRDTSKLLKAETDDLIAALMRPPGDDIGSQASTAESDKRTAFDENRRWERTEAESDILLRLTPQLSAKPDLSCDLVATESTDRTSRSVEETNATQSSPKQQACYNNCTAPTTSARTNDFGDDLQSAGETRKRMSRKSRGRGKVRELIRLFETASASTLENSSSPTDVRRATISAAVSVGELLRRFSEQDVIPRGPGSRTLLDDDDDEAEQPHISSSNVDEVRSNDDVAPAPRAIGDECSTKGEEGATVHKSAVRWPTLSRFRRKPFQRRVGTYEASVCDLSLIHISEPTRPY